MERLIDVFTKQGRRHVWTYSISLGGGDFHPSLSDFEREAIRRAENEHKGGIGELIATERRQRSIRR